MPSILRLAMQSHRPSVAPKGQDEHRTSYQTAKARGFNSQGWKAQQPRLLSNCQTGHSGSRYRCGVVMRERERRYLLDISRSGLIRVRCAVQGKRVERYDRRRLLLHLPVFKLGPRNIQMWQETDAPTSGPGSCVGYGWPMVHVFCMARDVALRITVRHDAEA